MIKKVTFKNKALRIKAAPLDSKENMTNLCTTFSQIMNLQNIIYFIVFAIPSVLLGQEVAKDVDLEIQRRIKLEINPSISIGILLPDGATKFYNYGQYDAEKKHKADSLTLYEIGSVTKTFTATLANLHSGQLLNTSISELFPECDNSSLEHITLEDLRNHVAGLPSFIRTIHSNKLV
jgi:CubicO group peptidase (beta-lactamase class C family)